MTFVADRCFDSLEQAFLFLFGQFVAPGPTRLWLQGESGLTTPHVAPPYLFRGECGAYAITKVSAARHQTFLLEDATPLATRDIEDVKRLVEALV